MRPERWAKIAQIYQPASERPPAERLRFLAEACGGDEDLRREIETLLAQEVSQDGLIERVAADAASVRTFPTSVGRFRLLRLIGEGGMGVVYEAEQDHPHRSVALKIVKSMLAGPELLRRFAHETEALGRLEHPGIARIYDAGTAESSWGPQPYFAMEFIRGLPLLEYANQQRLGTIKRIELMIKVCEAVDHAHQRRIIHRDLKPGNILVDESGQPKVLDFGVARIADTDANVTQQTKLGDLVGTLAYMSPEQVLADPTLLDVRSDVYSLGVLLYEFLAGRLPYRVSQQLTEAVRSVREEDASPLSTINRAYRGDLEIIVAKALEKEPARRYGSAGELADDLRRYLSHQPILAVAPTVTYQARKFVRRHRMLVIAATAVSIVLVTGIAFSTRQAILATRERDRALRAEQVAKAVSDFLQNDLLAQAGARAQASAGTEPDPNLTVRTALDRAAVRIAGRFDAQPVVEASVRRTIGTAYFELNRLSDAETQLQRAADLATHALGPEHPDTLSILDTLGVVYNYESKYGDAKTVLSKVFEARRRMLGNEHKDTLATISHLALAIAYEGDDARAMILFEPLLDAHRRVYGDENPGTLDIMDNLGGTYRQLGKYTQARALFEHELEISRRVLGSEHPDTLNCMGNLATVYRALGDYGQSEALSVGRLDATRRAFGDDHWETQSCRLSLAACYRAERRYADSEALVKQAVEQLNRSLPGHAMTFQAEYQLAELYRLERRFTEAESMFTNVIDARRRMFGDENSYTAQALASIGELRLDQQKYADAERPLREALHAREKTGPDGWERFYAQCMLGASVAGQGRRSDARPLLDSGYQGLVSRDREIPAEYRMNLERVRGWIADLGR
jgi:tetratricopeptide (TPR) repeat protein/predicted Ser/Thr protein kinase